MVRSASLDAAAVKVLATTNEAWVAMTSDGLIDAWNPAAERIFGWSYSEVVGRVLADVIVPERLRHAIARHVATGMVTFIDRRIEVNALHRDGDEFPVEVAVAAPGPGETVYHAFIRDISERKRRERYLDARRAVSTLLIGLGPRAPLLAPVTATLAETVGCEIGVLWTRGTDGAPVPERVAGPATGPDGEAPSLAAFRGDPLGEAWSAGDPIFQGADGEARCPQAQAPVPRCGLWLPVVLGDEVVAVMQLLALNTRRLDAAAADLLGPLATQVAHILQQRQTERQILSLNERNQSILDASSEGILGLDCEGRVVFANPAAAAALEASPAALVGRAVHDVVHGDGDHVRADCRLEETVRAGMAARFDGDCFAAVAEPITVDAACAPAALGPDAGPGAVLTFRDVTVRRALEDSRARNRDFLQSVLDNMEDGVRACDADGRLTFFNRAMEELAGKPALPIGPEEWAHEYGLRDVATGRLLPVECLPLNRALRGETVRGDEMLVTRPDGTTRRVIVNGRQLRSATGKVVGAVDVVHDITNERAAAQRMEEAELLASLGTWELDLVGDELFWSPGFFRLLGLDPGATEPTRERFYAAVHPDDRDRLARALSRALAGEGDQWRAEYRITRPDGEVRHHRSTSQLVRAADGEPLRALGIVQDYTERAHAEAALARTEARSFQVDRMQSLGQLAGGVAHDFNNLLAVILSSADFVLEDTPPGSPTRADVEEIRKAAQRAADLTRRLLVFSRREVVRPEPVHMGELVEGLAGLLRRTLGENLELIIDAADGVEPASVDFGQLEQVIINLALNARDAMPDGGVLRIEVAGVDVPSGGDDDLDPGRYVRVRVSDTGTGMTPEVAAHVFEPFFTTKAKGRGTGLGLATVYGAVNEANGSITVESKLGVGSTFTILLPATSSAPAAADDVAPASAGGAQAQAQQVLVVEDDASVRRVVRRILTQEGYTVLEAESCAEAMTALERCDGRVNLLLTDVIMPGASGWDLHMQAAARWPWIPTLLMSGYADDIVGREQVADADVEFIAKPFSVWDLLATVAAHALPANPMGPSSRARRDSNP